MNYANAENTKVGDILVAEYVYNMVLYKFFKVISRTNKTVKLVELEHTNNWHGYMENEVKPIDKKDYKKEEILTRRFTKNNQLSTGDYWFNLVHYDKKQIYNENHAD